MSKFYFICFIFLGREVLIWIKNEVLYFIDCKLLLFCITVLEFNFDFSNSNFGFENTQKTNSFFNGTGVIVCNYIVFYKTWKSRMMNLRALQKLFTNNLFFYIVGWSRKNYRKKSCLHFLFNYYKKKQQTLKMNKINFWNFLEFCFIFLRSVFILNMSGPIKI